MKTYYVNFDESGDLGFNFSNPHTTKWFIATFLICEDPKPIDKAVKTTYAAVAHSLGKKHTGMFHAFKEKESTNLRFLKELKKKEFSIASVRLNKKAAILPRQYPESTLYFYLANFLLQQLRREFGIQDVEINFTASRRFTKAERNLDFKQLLESANEKDDFPKVSVCIKKPFEERALQAVDLISWSLFQKYENDNSSYIDVLEEKTAFEYAFFE